MEIKRYIAIVRHWLWLVLLGALLIGALAYFYNSNRAPIYRASAQYLIDVASSSDTNSDYVGQLIAERLVQTYVGIISTGDTMESVRLELLPQHPELGNESGDSLRRMISVSTPLDTQIIVINVNSTSPQLAADIANAIGIVFSRENEARHNARFRDPIEQLDAQLAELDVLLAQTQTAIANFGTPQTAEQEAELSRLNRQLNEHQTNYNQAFQSRLDLQIEQARSLNNFVVIDSAKTPVAAISPRVWTNTILATLVGGLLTLGAVFLMEYLDDTVKTPDEIFDATGLSTLATIAFIKGDHPSERLITYNSPRAPVSEAYRVLRTNMSFAAIDTGLKSVLVTSSAPGEGKSTTIANMAVVIAQTGRRVILIDGDLRRPTQHKIFEVSNNQGLTTALLDSHTPLTRHLQETGVPGLRVMASGPLPPNPAELLNSNRMHDVITELGAEADVVLVDTPPVLSVADAAILAPRMSGCVLVVEVGATRMDMMQEAADRLRNAGAALFGLVLNRSKAGRSGYYHYYYNERYYTYEYASDRSKTRRAGTGRRILGWLTGGTGD